MLFAGVVPTLHSKPSDPTDDDSDDGLAEIIQESEKNIEAAKKHQAAMTVAVQQLSRRHKNKDQEPHQAQKRTGDVPRETTSKTKGNSSDQTSFLPNQFSQP